jgi:hypothetical protein
LEQACELAAGFIFCLLHAHNPFCQPNLEPSLRLTPSRFACLPPTSAQLLPPYLPPLLNIGRTSSIDSEPEKSPIVAPCQSILICASTITAFAIIRLSIAPAALDLHPLLHLTASPTAR